MANAHAQHGYKRYFVTWMWLLVMTLFAIGVEYAGMPYGAKAGSLVLITLAKIYLIASIFMHLKGEKTNLIMITFSPLLLALILFFITFGDTGGSPTHLIMVR